MISMDWTDPSIENKANDFAKNLRSKFVATAGYPALAVYVSYAHGDEPPQSMYGAAKLPRLTKLKQKWDPKNVFRFNNGLPTSSGGGR